LGPLPVPRLLLATDRQAIPGTKPPSKFQKQPFSDARFACFR
jgi:hypothetical protein